VCEEKLANKDLNEKEHFQQKFLEELYGLPENVKENLNKKLVREMREQGNTLAPLAIPGLEKYFGEFEVVSVEEQLFEPIREYVDKEFDFKGFIDLVVKTPDGKYHILDWKTCSWGWNNKKRSDPMVTYQLTFYKHYFAKKHNIDVNNIETHFALLKRTAKKDHVELFRVTSGKKKTENALNLLNKALHNIDKGKHLKNRASCSSPFGMCEFFKSEHCS
tara:strand:+ start:785 stop:1441 length:657 start_codon:yes stop_codon:yes gene_type:complete